MYNFRNKTAIVTGAGSGIGKAIALLLAAHEASVFVLDISEEKAKATVEEIRENNGKANAFVCDVTSQAAVNDIFSQVGSIDILVNSAGISHIGKLDSTTEQDLDRVYQVNVKGVYNCLFAAIKFMKEKKSGVILNIASVASHVGIPDRFAYSMSKGAVYAMTLSVAKDYIHDGIRCVSISPARVHTEFVDGFLSKNYPGKEKEMFEKLSATQPLGRMAKPEEIAHLALYLCSGEAAFITGCDYPIDGGFLKLNN